MAQDNPFRGKPTTPEDLLAGMWDTLSLIQATAVALAHAVDGHTKQIQTVEEWIADSAATLASKQREVGAYERGVQDGLKTAPLITKRHVAIVTGAAGAVMAALQAVTWAVGRF